VMDNYKYDGLSHSARLKAARRADRGAMGLWAAAAVGLIVIVVLIVSLIGSYYKHHTTTLTVEHKENVCKGSGDSVSCTYMVFTNQGAFELSNHLFGGNARFNSTEAYGRLKEGHTYKVDYYGWRISLFDQYPNINTFQEVTP